MNLRRSLGAALAVAALLCAPINEALANFAISPTGSSTLFAVDSSNTTATGSSGCASVECPAHVLIDSTGALFGVPANALSIKPGTGATFGLAAGAQIVGKVGIDQTTPGTTNLVAAGESGTWNVGLTGTLPAFAATPTFNVGTIGTIATQTTSAAILAALGSPFQAGGSIGNTGFNVTGTLPAFAATPTFNVGTIAGIATQTTLASLLTAVGSPMQTTGGTVNPGTLSTWGLGVVGNAAAPTNMQVGGLVYNSTPLTLANGQSSALQGDNHGYTEINCVVGCSASSSITGWGGSTIGTGTIQAFGATVATIGAGLVPAVNAYVANAAAPGQATMSASSPITVASDQSAIATKAASGAFVAGSIADLAHGQGTMAASVPVALASDQSVGDPCMFKPKLFADFESPTSGGQLVAGTSGKKTYICGIAGFVSAATNISLLEGTGSSVCTGGTPAAVFFNTSTTAANGAALPANGGLTFGNGGGELAATATNADNLCVVFTTTNTPQVNLHVAYVQQ